MNNKLPLISYTFAAMAGICFVRGLVILSSEGRNQNVPTRGAIIDDRPFTRHE